MGIWSSQDSSEIQGIKHGEGKTCPMLSTYWVMSAYTEKSIFCVMLHSIICAWERMRMMTTGAEKRDDLWWKIAAYEGLRVNIPTQQGGDFLGIL